MRDPEPKRSFLSIELLLDRATEAAVRAEWDALAALGVSSLAHHTSTSNRPHVTLLVRTELDPFDAHALLQRSPIEVTLSAPLLFGTGERRVLARSIVPTAELLDIHAAVHAVAGTGDDAPHTTPGNWTPHVTLARRLRVVDLPAALEHVGGEIHGRATGLRLWDPTTATVTDLGTFA
ncbi:2'-5' RNA ligase family protein [Microbacterium sp. W4I20]|uniref:2'-5' RNA ligase family protein n=1 Tax=Microbacterium sp. W4I20 TaxID=3042262 RepID=UPI0027899075|nr:2'-5' RNA ligase family protein [Microbacterium sp. W4I20]MDQ0727263.1 2'-5' RNA ligase [Microbacterium sp. W4I20]